MGCEVNLSQRVLDLVGQILGAAVEVGEDEEAMRPGAVVENVQIDVVYALVLSPASTVRVLHFAVPCVERFDHPLPMRPSVDVLVVQFDVTVAVPLFSRIVSRELDKEVTMHPTA